MPEGTPKPPERVCFQRGVIIAAPGAEIGEPCADEEEGVEGGVVCDCGVYSEEETQHA